MYLGLHLPREARMSRISIGEISLNVVEEGQGTPLLLVHGFPLDHRMWLGQIAGLTDSYRVIAPDLRGFGQSDVTPGTATMEQHADDLAKLLDTLGVTEPIAFCGLSMGGYIAWQFFARHRQKLGKLILCDTRAIADSPDAAKGRMATADKVIKEGSQVVAEAMLGKLFAPAAIERKAEFVESTRQVMLGTKPEGVAAALRGMAARVDFTSRLASIDVPTLVLCGTSDAIAPLAEMQGIAAAIPGAKFAEIPDAGHMAPLEQPAAVNDRLRKFLAGTLV